VIGCGGVGTAAVAGARLAGEVHVALVNGAAGMVATRDDRVFAVLGFTVVDDRIVAIDALSDPDRLAELDVTFLS
jgi:RNA polymerase sigma-70 factor (ECF subfamily)